MNDTIAPVPSMILYTIFFISFIILSVTAGLEAITTRDPTLICALVIGVGGVLLITSHAFNMPIADSTILIVIAMAILGETVIILYDSISTAKKRRNNTTN